MTFNPHKRKQQTAVVGMAFANIRRTHKRINVLCLPGATGWDIKMFRYLSGCGHITALEEDTNTYCSLIKKFPADSSLSIENIKTSEFLCTTSSKFELIYLDYFSNLNSIVRFDLETILARRLIVPGGQLIMNIYGARESITDQYCNRMYYEKAAAKFDRTVQDTLNAELLRCRAFNSMVILHQLEYGVGASSVRWSKYRSNNAYMYTASLSVHRYKAQRVSGLKSSANLKFMEGQYSCVKEFRAKKLSGAFVAMAKRNMPGAAEEYWKSQILKFYNQHGYTPVPRDLGVKKGSIKSYTKYVRDLTLCPRVNSCEVDLVQELRRIAARDGYVTAASIQRAKIGRKLGWAAEFRRLCEINNLPYVKTVQLSKQLEHRKRKQQILDQWITHLKLGNPKSKFKHYSFMRKNKLLNLNSALNELFSINKEIQTKETLLCKHVFT